MDCNTTSSNPTHFLRAVELIHEARATYKIPSENWPYPMNKRLGCPRDLYYAEIWQDGMDWQNSYWLIESSQYNSPICLPAISFMKHEEEEKLMGCVDELFDAILFYRRDLLWIKRDPKGPYGDSVWPFLDVFMKDSMESCPCMVSCFFKTASTSIEFFINKDLLPLLDD